MSQLDKKIICFDALVEWIFSISAWSYVCSVPYIGIRNTRVSRSHNDKRLVLSNSGRVSPRFLCRQLTRHTTR